MMFGRDPKIPNSTVCKEVLRLLMSDHLPPLGEILDELPADQYYSSYDIEIHGTEWRLWSLDMIAELFIRQRVRHIASSIRGNFPTALQFIREPATKACDSYQTSISGLSATTLTLISRFGLPVCRTRLTMIG